MTFTLRSWLGLLPFALFLSTSALHCSSGSSDATILDGSTGEDPDASEEGDAHSISDAKSGSDSAKACGASCAGCCDGATCVKTTSATQCGAGGKACSSCGAATSGHACVGGVCGCKTIADCASGFSCNPATNACEKSCSVSDPCPSGCCDSNGLCAQGDQTSACGNTAACVNCAGTAGHACIAGGKCGCATEADCFSGYACDASTHTCTKACSAGSPCNGGCCKEGTCTSPAKTACGSGTACVDCTGKPEGGSCVGVGGVYKCGCFGASDCAAGQACDSVTHSCTTTCSATQQCNGGCCNGTTCAAGTTDTACGGVKPGFVATCESCTASPVGGICKATSGSYVARCGCTIPGDCKSPSLCQSGACCLPKGQFSGNSGLCCSKFTVNQVCQ